MKYLLYMGILLGVLLLPERGTDVGKLIPVGVVAISGSGFFSQEVNGSAAMAAR